MSIFDKIVKFSQGKDIGHIQNVCGSTAMALSCLAFTGSVLFNKGIPKEQKEFLVSQELADGVINVGLFWLLTSRFNKWAKDQVATCQRLPKDVKEDVLKAKKILGDDASLEKIKKEVSPKALEKIEHFEKSFPALISLSGSLLAASIVTPIVRNIIASKFQQRNNDEEPAKPAVVQTVSAPEGNVYISHKPQEPTGPVPRKPLLPAYQAFSSRGGMRI